MRKFALALAATAALSVTAPAEATIVNYSFGGAGSGTMALDFDGSNYSLSALNLTLGSVTFDTSNSAMTPWGGTNYLLGTTAIGGPGAAQSGTDTFWSIFNASSASQTTFVHWSNVGDSLHINDELTITQVAGAVPEPASWAMMLVGFAGIGFALRRRRTMALA
jgi:hypothetical protein